MGVLDFIPCGKCDNGVFRTAGGVTVCQCLQEHNDLLYIKDKFGEFGFNQAWIKASFKSYNPLTPKDAEVITVLNKFASDLESNVNEGYSIFLQGESNTGKTHLAMALCVIALKKGIDACGTSVADYLDRVSLSWSLKREEDLLRIQRIKDCKLLLLDDVTASSLTSFNTKQSLVENLIKVRSDRSLSTVITSDFIDPTQVMNGLGVETFKVLQRMYLFLKLEGDYTPYLAENLKNRFLNK